MSDYNTERWEGKTAEELLASLLEMEPGSKAHEQVKAALQLRIVELQRGTAKDALTWAKLAAISTAVATVVAVVALLVALF